MEKNPCMPYDDETVKNIMLTTAHSMVEFLGNSKPAGQGKISDFIQKYSKSIIDAALHDKISKNVIDTPPNRIDVMELPEKYQHEFEEELSI